MGEVVEFRTLRRDAVPQAGAIIEVSAQILFFTGVRYVHGTDDSDMPAAAPRPRRSRRRSWLNARHGKRTKPSSRNSRH
jgi:hypothetical protein